MIGKHHLCHEKDIKSSNSFSVSDWLCNTLLTSDKHESMYFKLHIGNLEPDEDNNSARHLLEIETQL